VLIGDAVGVLADQQLVISLVDGVVQDGRCSRISTPPQSRNCPNNPKASRIPAVAASLVPSSARCSARRTAETGQADRHAAAPARPRIPAAQKSARQGPAAYATENIAAKTTIIAHYFSGGADYCRRRDGGAGSSGARQMAFQAGKGLTPAVRANCLTGTGAAFAPLVAQ
jgi:hypothetical protein